METLANLESFTRSAETGSFSAAARRLALTPAAVSRNVAQLERNLGVRLFQRSTRGLALTEAGERLLHGLGGGLAQIHAAIADVSANAGQPAGVLKLAAAPGFGSEYLLPLMPAFLARYPAIVPDWDFDNRQVDLVRDGFDAAVGGGIELTPGVVARELARVHVVAVAAPAYLRDRPTPQRPGDLDGWDGILRRSPRTGRINTWALRHADGTEASAALKPRMVVNDPDALRQALLLGLGVGMLPLTHVHRQLASGALCRVLPEWHAEVGPVSLYFASQKLLPAKTRAFVDFVTESFREQRWARRFAAD